MTDAPAPTLEGPPPSAAPPAPDVEAVKARFAEQYPRAHRLATFQHRGLYGDTRDDAVADTIALAWKAYLQMALQGSDPDRQLGSIVRYSAKHVRAGKLIGGQPHVTDVLSRRARARNGHHVTSLPGADDEGAAGEVRDALAHRAPGPDEEAACRVDYEDWLASLSEKQRGVAEGLASGLNLTEVARRRGVSKAAAQQVRETLSRKWDERFGDGERGR